MEEAGTCVAVAVKDETIRRSIVFVIKAHGHFVLLLESLTWTSHRPHCLVLDLPTLAIPGPKEQLSLIGCPSVLLTDALQQVPPWYSGQIVLLPLLGNTFLEAIDRAIAAQARAPAR